MVFMVAKIYDFSNFLCENWNVPFQKDDESNLKQFKITLNATQKILICLDLFVENMSISFLGAFGHLRTLEGQLCVGKS